MDQTKKIQDCSFDDFIKNCLENVSRVMKNANNLPLADYDYWSIDKCFGKAVDLQSSRMINMIQHILTKHGFKNRLSEGGGVDDDDRLAHVTSICDQLLERINTNLDEASGKKASNALLLVSKQATPTNKHSTDTSPTFPSFSLMTQKSIPKPQGSFKDKVDNSELPFAPRITYKPHALQPLEESLVLECGEFTHPYAFELQSLQVDEALLQPVQPKSPLPLDKTPFTFIDKEEQLEVLVEKLLNVSEVAVDLEHHSFRSFQGFTCLMQVSTRSEDFIIDTLLLRHHMHLLNPVFTHPGIVKVLHGSDSDVQWLQKDFGVYLVNLFDTGQAARLLQLPHFSLAYLLQIICDVTADKRFQKADWRIRDLPETFLKYAREDTHYLLYIYDVIRNMLLERGGKEGGGGEREASLLLQAFRNSNQICKKRYKKPVLKASSHVEMYERKMGRGGVVLARRGVEVLRKLYAWRDKLARIEDESTGYILPDEIMLQIAHTLPVTAAEILQCCRTYIPPVLKRQLEDVKIIINDDITQPSFDEGMEEQLHEEAMKSRHQPSQRYLPSFTHPSFEQIDYDDSFLNSNSKINTVFDSSFFQSPGEQSCDEAVLSRLNKIFLPYMPEDFLPKDYKRGTFKVRFMATVPVEEEKAAVVIEPEEVNTTPEIKLSDKDSILRKKINSEKEESIAVKKSKKEKVVIPTTSNSTTTTNSDFKAKVYNKDGLKGVLKEGGKLKNVEGGKRGVYNANEDLATSHVPVKKSRKNFHKGNKSHSFKPNQ